MIVETPVTIFARALVKAWWSLLVGTVVFGVVGTNGF